MSEYRLDRTAEMRSANYHILGGSVLMRTHHSREIIYKSGTLETVSVRSRIMQSGCDHEMKTSVMCSGGGIMSTNYEITFCEKCGMIEKAEYLG